MEAILVIVTVIGGAGLMVKVSVSDLPESVFEVAFSVGVLNGALGAELGGL
jgi:hypothetical protein